MGTWREARRITPVLWGLSWALAFGCEGNHSGLEVEPAGPGGGGAGGGGEGGAGGGLGGGLPGGEGGVGAAPVEPGGPPTLTVVNGVIDYPAIALCFSTLAGPPPTTFPWPEDGLGFGAAAEPSPVSDAVPPDADVLVHVLGGDLASLSGVACGAIVEDPGGFPGVLVAPLGMIPEVVWSTERSLLLVPNGCLGGAGHQDGVQAQVCGAGYDADQPTVGLLAGSMSRITAPDKVGLQLAQASSAAPVFDVYLTRGFSAEVPLLFAPLLTPGAILPYPPFAPFSPVELGVLDEVTLTTFLENSAVPTSETTLETVFAGSAIAGSDLLGGRNYVVVAVGAPPGAPTGPWWHDFTLVLVDAHAEVAP